MVSSLADRRLWNAALEADQSAAFMAKKLRAQEPFFYLRYGDGALECMVAAASGQPPAGRTCDGERYTPELGKALRSAWDAVAGQPNVYIGDWMSASFDSDTEQTRYADQYAALIEERDLNFLHFEALLLMRESRELVDFYRAVKEDPRRKVFMGPESLQGAARMLGANHLLVPMKADLHSYFEACSLKLRDLPGFEVVLYGAGMAAHPQVFDCWKRFPERTYINLGSAMDPLFRGKTRQQQLAPARARALFQELL
jgi:hypothetical protein